MVKVNYKYILHGELFTFQGQEYTKTSHGRGVYYKVTRQYIETLNH